MDESRRRFLVSGVAAALFPLSHVAKAEAAPADHGIRPTTPINVILPRQYTPPQPGDKSDYNFQLTRATLAFVKEHYQGRYLPTWGRKYDEVDLQKRVSNIIYWVMQGVHQHKGIYPVDPAWIVSQIMAESFFNEFAISPAFAVGVCQFMPSTAKAYGMRLYDPGAGERLQLKNQHQAQALQEYSRLRSELRSLRKKHTKFRAGSDSQLKTILEAIVQGRPVEDAEEHLLFLVSEEELQQKIKETRRSHIEFLKSNFQDRSIFRQGDLDFLTAFDERVTYRKPVMAMVQMMAEALRARNGNILAAAAAYNAGLSRTREIGLYKPFGRIPGIKETVTYVSRILINHHEIVNRMA